MTFDLSFPTEAGDVHPLRLDVGETLFVLGANGTGKSSLMFRFNAQNHDGRGRFLRTGRPGCGPTRWT